MDTADVEFSKQAQHDMVMAGYVPSKQVDDLVAFEASRLVAEGATEETASSLARVALADGKARRASIEAMRASQPTAFIKPAATKDTFTEQYRRIVKAQGSRASEARLVERTLQKIEQTKSKMSARRGGVQ